MKEEEIRKSVKDRYSTLARGIKSHCCEPHVQCCAGYEEGQLKQSPQEAAEVSAGCGNPTSLAEIVPGMTVLDLGSGGGFDAFLAAEKVGPDGQVIGVDATPDMVWRARKTAEEHGYKNVEFRLGEIEYLPVESETVDLIISNCVINLSPDKPRVFREAFRVLRPGGRLMVSDIVTMGAMPEEIKRSLVQWAQCLAGAIPEDEYLGGLREAGFEEVGVLGRQVYNSDQIESFIRAEGLDISLAQSAAGVFASSYISARRPE